MLVEATDTKLLVTSRFSWRAARERPEMRAFCAADWTGTVRDSFHQRPHEPAHQRE